MRRWLSWGVSWVDGHDEAEAVSWVDGHDEAEAVLWVDGHDEAVSWVDGHKYHLLQWEWIPLDLRINTVEPLWK